ncbi:hypothetical protein PUNSTDRAFT_122165 [Punctularia strigosozonata HHB-11173 SS5]|uniref:uncharacterized protein n=1 Tax=Punctularia strigosozonata (strain HHB-11173) TaxID=741275 RepID=UPI0004418551|nr:uncharacterized protein PUNSTDRAFT_122165 [Punctularia strigosozonata HHB-11173 SS5]EIN05680.1 hypothetical protein PUNSTDRAFT_122165 [Punctularia strigosozonata HHB-11173 SS5]
MDTASSRPSASRGSSSQRSRGSHKPRGGHGKALRARGRGRGGGRPAVFRERILLEGEAPEDLDEEAEAELRAKYSRRNLGSNADRYKEEDPELGSDGEPIVEPEVDLSAFLRKQRLHDEEDATPGEDDQEVDHSLDHLPTGIGGKSKGKVAEQRKGKVQHIALDDELEKMLREKAVADANRELKERFRVQAAKPTFQGSVANAGRGKGPHREKDVLVAPPLPGQESKKDPNAKDGLEDFLDELLG